MIYLTYNDLPSGIYYSQVIDVCNFVSKEINVNIRLVALISIRGYWTNRKKIKSALPNSIVLPMIPKHENWELNKFLLFLRFIFIPKQEAVCRGIFATNLAMDLKKAGLITKVIFDGRGAYRAEFEEYLNKIVKISDDIRKLEKKAVLNSDYCLAVSQELVNYWKSEYQFDKQNYDIIPCTLNSRINPLESEEKIILLRKKFNYTIDDVLIIYSGSSADWQSIEIMDEFLLKQLDSNKSIHVVLLSKFDLKSLKSYINFPERISQKWVRPSEVKEYLSIGDYGLLLREFSITNKVSSPTKFAEYLNEGLKIIISPEIGDFSNIVIENNLGFIYKTEFQVELSKVPYSEKVRMSKFASNNYTKKKYLKEYKRILKS